jgi:hypothetical protein
MYEALEKELKDIEASVAKSKEEYTAEYHAAAKATVEMRDIMERSLGEKFARECFESEADDYTLFLKDAVRSVENYRKEKNEIAVVFNVLTSVVDKSHEGNMRKLEEQEEKVRTTKVNLDKLRKLLPQ